MIVRKCNMQHPFHHRKVCPARLCLKLRIFFINLWLLFVWWTPKSLKFFKFQVVVGPPLQGTKWCKNHHSSQAYGCCSPRLFALGCEAAGLKVWWRLKTGGERGWCVAEKQGIDIEWYRMMISEENNSSYDVIRYFGTITPFVEMSHVSVLTDLKPPIGNLYCLPSIARSGPQYPGSKRIKAPTFFKTVHGNNPASITYKCRNGWWFQMVCIYPPLFRKMIQFD